MKEYKDLIEEYSAITEELFEYTEEYYDAMNFDIEGYVNMFHEKEYGDIESLRNQVEAFNLILEGIKKMNYLFC